LNVPAVSAEIGMTIRLAILLPVRPAIFLPDIRLREYHIRQDGRGWHGHDQAGNHFDFQ
jgi:hypothetical protein